MTGPYKNIKMVKQKQNSQNKSHSIFGNVSITMSGEMSILEMTVVVSFSSKPNEANILNGARKIN